METAAVRDTGWLTAGVVELAVTETRNSPGTGVDVGRDVEVAVGSGVVVAVGNGVGVDVGSGVGVAVGSGVGVAVGSGVMSGTSLGLLTLNFFAAGAPHPALSQACTRATHSP